MRESYPAGLKALIVFLVIVMVGNVLLLARSLEILRFPGGEITDTEVVRGGGARVLAAYYETTIARCRSFQEFCSERCACEVQV